MHLPFKSVTPDIDESSNPDEAPDQLVIRLATIKATKVSQTEPEAVIIGSDQLAVLNGETLGKPGSHEFAFRQLQSMRGQCVRFYTGLCVLNSATGNTQTDCITVDVNFRNYSDTLIERYLEAEQPYNCAGSFKSEQLGISLVKHMDGPDPTALIGLPLIKLCDMLAKEGLEIPL